MQGITVNVGPPPPPPGPPPPPPAGGQPRYVVRGHAIPLEPHKLLALGNLGIGIALIVVNALSFIGTFITFQLLAFVILLFLVLGGCLLSAASLFSSRLFALYVGFVQYPLGTGMLLVLLGVLNLGNGGITGMAVGGTAIGWGAVNCLLHMWLRPKNAAVHIPLLK